MIERRDEIISKIERRLNGQVSAAELAAWAFALFYARAAGHEEGDDEFEPLLDPIAEVLDELIFADDANFTLEEADLRRLLARLREL